jgi:hypothetical protein
LTSLYRSLPLSLSLYIYIYIYLPLYLYHFSTISALLTAMQNRYTRLSTN